MPKRKIIAKNMAGGLQTSKGETNLKENENIESRNMQYQTDGGIRTTLGYGDIGVDLGEDGEGVDGPPFVMENYPNLCMFSVNGKIKYLDLSTQPLESANVYNVDTALSLTKDNPVFMREYRGMLYYCNGVEDLGMVAVGKLSDDLSTTPDDEVLNIRSSSYQWTQSVLNSNYYYLNISGGGDPGFSEPTRIKENGVAMTQVSSPSVLAAGEWAFGNGDSLGYNTVYVRLSDSADPDGKSDGFVTAEWDNLIELGQAEGYKFNDAADKVYVEGDEIDYVGVMDGGTGDALYEATNIASAHDEGMYVTQYNAIPSNYKPTLGSIKARTMAFFRNTMWIAGMPDEPNVLRYGKTIASVADILTGNIHNFSDGENYLIGEGGEITALHATRDRLYVFQPNKTFYIGIEIDSTGQENFSPERMFTPDYGCPNPFCVVEMEDVVVFFTGRRLIRIGYDPNAQELLPDKEFDEAILSVLERADKDQSDARLHYNSATKELYITIKINGLLKTIRYNNRTKAYSGLDDHDPSGYVQYDRYTFFGDRENDKLYRFGLSLDADDVEMVHRVQTGRLDDKTRNMKLFLRGKVEGRKRPGDPIVFGTEVEGELFGGYRQITDNVLKQVPTTGSTGTTTTGDDVVGSDLPQDEEDMRPFTYSFVIGRRGRDISLFWSTYASGARWQIDSFEIEYEENMREPTKHY